MTVLPTTGPRAPGLRRDHGAPEDHGGGNGRVDPDGTLALERCGSGTDAELEGLVRRMLELLGEDPQRDGLRDTPARVRKSLQWLTRGYGLSSREAVGSALFEERHGAMVLVRDLDVHSLCEHHMLPFFGRAHVAYVPAGRIVGLSKLARVIDVYARRLQVQERLTEDIAGALVDVLRPEAVGVVIEARHHCMMMRGVQQQSSTTVTMATRGAFAHDGPARSEFLRIATGAGAAR